MLQDIPGLPPLWAETENRMGKELLLLTSLRLLARKGLRPIGINTDNIEADFKMIASVLEAALPPGMVLYRFVSPHQPLQEDAKQHVASGGIVIDREHCQAFGVEIGQDGLHIYARLVQGLHLASRDGAFAVQCLRKMLASWNPCRREATPQGELALELEGVEPKTIGWLTLSDSPGETCLDVLAAYFGPDQTALPSNALQLLKDNISNTWNHPNTAKELPRCAKAVILQDVLSIKDGRRDRSVCLGASRLSKGSKLRVAVCCSI